MESGSPLDNLSKLPRFRSFMLKVALMGVGLLLVAFVLRFTGVHFNDALYIVGFGTLAVVAFCLGQLFPYHPVEGNDAADLRLRPIWNFAMTISGYALAALLLGALFAFKHWPGGRTMLILGLIALGGCAMAWLFFFIQRNKQ